MNKTQRKLQQRIEIKNEKLMPELAKTLYEDTFDENSYTPDLIIKTGQEKHEFFCHRLIFAASSDFVRKLIETATPGTIPVIFLPDTETSVMTYVILYIYHGEATIPSEIYDEFVEACELLQLKGSIREIKSVTQDDVQCSDNFEGEDDINEETKTLENEQEMEPVTFKKEMSVESFESEEPSLEKELTTKTKTNWNLSRPLHRLVKVPKEKEKIYLNRLIFCLRNSYNKCRIPITYAIETRLQNSQLIIDRGLLIKGDHQCGICGKQISSSYSVRKETISWINRNITYHLNRCRKK